MALNTEFSEAIERTSIPKNTPMPLSFDRQSELIDQAVLEFQAANVEYQEDGDKQKFIDTYDAIKERLGTSGEYSPEDARTLVTGFNNMVLQDLPEIELTNDIPVTQENIAAKIDEISDKPIDYYETHAGMEEIRKVMQEQGRLNLSVSNQQTAFFVTKLREIKSDMATYEEQNGEPMPLTEDQAGFVNSRYLNERMATEDEHILDTGGLEGMVYPKR